MDFNWQEILSWLLGINSLVLIVFIILQRKKTEKTIAWILILLFLPLLGLILYMFLGVNWKREKNKLIEQFSPYVRKPLCRAVNELKNYQYHGLIELLARNSDAPLFVGNQIKVFNCGQEKFAALKEEMLKAQHHIHLEYYIVESDNIGNEIKDILIQKAKEGVKVRFIMDKVGSIRVKKSYFKELRDAGVDVIQYSYFLAPLFKFINTHINFRNHRKIAVIDGMVGFVGGMNIGDDYLGKGRLGHWRDTHLMIKGDFVRGLQAIFLDDFWTIKKANGESFFYVEDFRKYFPELEKNCSKVLQLVKSGPGAEYPAIMHGMLKMISMAKDHIYITTPYFVPTESIQDALKVAAMSGVDVRILFPGRYDHAIVHYASKTYLAELLKCGAKVYFYRKDAFVHSKVLTVDGQISTVGTANMDIRSYQLNYEVNAIIYDREITGELEQQFHKDLKESTLLTLDEYEKTPRITKWLEAVARVFSYFL
ncbi:cardiolipin synthase [Desulfofalx alkaliphila]|uniref:cardiolipin synthase n=1 Tax=Desulfofalx alkaliphila TaxID=105483 RepID=UPI0004E0B042|nr:cardiolipin synthase [Desulfofalx alkaliphila]